MQSKETYKNLDHSLGKMRIQILEGIQYASKNLPHFDTPQQIFDYFKKRVQYKSDPHNIELFQTLPTLLENNFWGINKSGYGDCDCFTIALLSTLLANKFFNSGIVLVGRSPKNAVHIYAYTDVKGEHFFLDLTNKYFNQVRFYPYSQTIPFKLSNTEKQKIKSMYLQLADNNNESGLNIYSLGAKGKWKAQRQQNKANRQQRRTDKHVYLPSKEIYVREDLFDVMPDEEFIEGMSEEGYSLSQIAELSKGRQQRKQAKKQGKQAIKSQRIEGRQKRKQTNAELKNRISGEQKAGLLKGLTKIGGAVAGKFTGTQIDTDTPDSPSGNAKEQAPDKESFFTKNKTPILIGGGLLLVALIAVPLLKNKNPKRK